MLRLAVEPKRRIGVSAGVGCTPFQSRLPEQKARDYLVDGPQHRREQLQMGGEQDAMPDCFLHFANEPCPGGFG